MRFVVTVAMPVKILNNFLNKKLFQINQGIYVGSYTALTQKLWENIFKTIFEIIALIASRRLVLDLVTTAESRRRDRDNFS